MNIKLVVGLGNPGDEYDKTRHNAGAWFAEALANSYGASFRSEKKFHGKSCQLSESGEVCHLLLPTTFMNHSGQAVRALMNFYKIPIDTILVVHDELDLPAGVVRLKQGGGHGGHNGLRDIISHLSGRDFLRLRIGIGHPGHQDRVHDYVLSRPSVADKQKIQFAIDEAMAIFPSLLQGHTQQAMQALHTNSG